MLYYTVPLNPCKGRPITLHDDDDDGAVVSFVRVVYGVIKSIFGNALWQSDCRPRAINIV